MIADLCDWRLAMEIGDCGLWALNRQSAIPIGNRQSRSAIGNPDRQSAITIRNRQSQSAIDNHNPQSTMQKSAIFNPQSAIYLG
jgi:hypothetical protein